MQWPDLILQPSPTRYHDQGDQIGRILAYWATVSSGKFCENYGNSTNNWATIFHGKKCVLIFTRNGLGYILGDFFTNAHANPSIFGQFSARNNSYSVREIYILPTLLLLYFPYILILCTSYLLHADLPANPLMDVASIHARPLTIHILSRSQSYDRALQRQRCKILLVPLL
jgi:hypothetical protein